MRGVIGGRGRGREGVSDTLGVPGTCHLGLAESSWGSDFAFEGFGWTLGFE